MEQSKLKRAYLPLDVLFNLQEEVASLKLCPEYGGLTESEFNKLITALALFGQSVTSISTYVTFTEYISGLDAKLQEKLTEVLGEVETFEK